MAYSTSFLDFKRVLKEEMLRFGELEFADNRTAEVSRKIEGVKNTMKSNIDKLWERDSQIEDLLEKTELLETESTTFKTNTKKLASHFWWKNFKIWVIIIVVSIILVWLVASLACGFRFQCLKKCFHADSMVTLAGGQRVTLDQLRAGAAPECVVPHVVTGQGVRVTTSCGNAAALRLTSDHLVSTLSGWVEAGALVPGTTVFGALDGSIKCEVLDVARETQVQTYFGLNCPESVVLADGIRVSTFGRHHTLPALWMKYVSQLLGIHRASSWGDALADMYFMFAAAR